jgi:lipopolysaccharide transport system ATP-binding protein
MSNTVISVENLSKAYRLGQIGTGTFTNDLKLWWAKARNKPNPLLKIGETDHGNRDGETLWALKDVSFTVEQGEVLGIIGRNGAGKSTLLKILSRVTAPTSGRIRVKGRIASLLEVGTGFHPELTGRENIYLNGAILGMKHDEITRKFDEIVDFAEVEKFIDTPVKRYSSGMYVRLAFAVAAHLDPEILVVDEVLAVGDTEFQKKCLGKMGDVAQEGRTVLFVSHNMSAISSLTKRSLLFSAGKLTFLGSTENVITSYFHSSNFNSADLDSFRQQASGDDVVLKQILVNGKTLPQTLWFDQDITFEFMFVSKISVPNASITVLLKDKLNQIISSICSYDYQIQLPIQPGENFVFLRIPAAGLTPGFYSFDVAINPSFIGQWFDCLRSVTLGDVVISENLTFPSLTASNRTWGAIHYFDATWSVLHESK